MHKERQTDIGDNIISTWHELMKEYGWIPLEEFRKLPGITVDALCEEINRDRKQRQKEIEKAKNRRMR
jgi:hypothetical protein